MVITSIPAHKYSLHFPFLPLAPFFSSKIFFTALLASLVTASGSSASLLVEKDCFLKNLNNVAISLDRWIELEARRAGLRYPQIFACFTES